MLENVKECFDLSTECGSHGGKWPRESTLSSTMRVDFLSASSDIAGASWPNFPGQRCSAFSKYADDILVILNGERGRVPELFKTE